MSVPIRVFCYSYIKKKKKLRAYSLALIASDSAHVLFIHTKCLVPAGKMATINLARNRYQNFHVISIYGLINYGCPLDEDICVNGRQGRREN